MDAGARDFPAARFAAPQADKTTTLERAVARHVRPGDALHLGATHVRGAAAAWEILRRFRGTDPGFEIQSLSMSTTLAPLLHEGLVRRVVTTWAGDAYYSPGPNPVFADARDKGVEFQHWSILTFPQRLQAAARGLEWTTTKSLIGSDLARDNAGDVRELQPGLMLIRSLTPDLSFFHAPAADAAGNVIVPPPLLENVWGALAARRGAIVTVERIVDADVVRAHSSMVKIPSHAVVAVCEVPFGAHPGGVFARDVDGVTGYGEDYPFWAQMRAACRDPSALDDWIREWILEPPDRAAYVRRLGRERIDGLIAQADPASVPASVHAAIAAVDPAAPVTPAERAIVAGARLLAERIQQDGLTHMLAGAGMSNLAAWLAAAECADAGVAVDLVAEMGLVGYRPNAAEPFIFNHRNFPSCSMLSDIETVLGVLMGGARARSVAALGAAQIDKRGNLNTTMVGGRMLMGSGGANDVATAATCSIVTMTQERDRFVDRVEYVTSPGERIVAMATTHGIYRKDGGEFVLTAVYDDDLEAGIRAAVNACGWDLRVAPAVERIPPPAASEIETLRMLDPDGYFRGR